MPSPGASSPKIVWLSVVSAFLAALILFDAVFAIGAALDWALLGLYDASPLLMLTIGAAIAAFSCYLAVRFFRLAYRADLELD
ncbi:hypothetical protein [Fodinicurvata fenggangensis]|uniref:hypothetical protein n=1 Tax=Fodinicurvata fenggangensis TaxID=1121830 RepID=UPI000478F8B1|nr:hypothetical protein [Fodinicurvata fenggangensis]